MRRRKAYLLAATIGAVAPVAAAIAQDAETAPPPPPPRAPVFSLPPGDPVDPEPEVQGPRAPGVSAPRLIRPESERRPAQRPPQVGTQQPAPAPVETRASPPSSEQPAPSTARRPPAPAVEETASDAEVAAPDILDIPLPDIADGPQDMPAESMPTTIGESEDAGGLPWWLFAGLGLLAVALAAFFRRRGREETVQFAESEALAESGTGETAEPVAEEPSISVQASPPPLPVAPAPAPADAPARVAIDFEPLVARFLPGGFVVSYRLHVENICDEDVHDVAVCLGIRGADHDAMQHRVEPGAPCVTLDTLPVNRRAVHEGEIGLDAASIRPLQIEGKPMLVPIIDLMPRYRDAGGALHEHHAALLLGREHNPPTAKMAPFRLDGGFTQLGKLGCRMLSVREPGRAAA